MAKKKAEVIEEKKEVVKKPRTEKVKATSLTISLIKVDIKNLSTPLSFVDVNAEEVVKNKDIYFADREQAKRYAKNELLDRKDKIKPNDYNEAYWFIENFV